MPPTPPELLTRAIPACGEGPFHDCDEVASALASLLYDDSGALTACMLCAEAQQVPTLPWGGSGQRGQEQSLLPRGTALYAAFGFENLQGRGLDFYIASAHQLIGINEVILQLLPDRYSRDARHRQALLVPHHPRYKNRFNPCTDVAFALGELLYGSQRAFPVVML